MSASTHGKGPMTVMVGPCVIEDRGLTLEIAEELKRQLDGVSAKVYFKASFDKANRTSMHSFRGPGLKKGLEILAEVRERTGFPVLTDFHGPEQAEPVADIVDVIQVPAFLCRQTDMIVAAARSALRHGIRLNIKKGQFLAPWDTRNIIEKVNAVQREMGEPERGDWFTMTERGVSFGYNALVVDMVAFQCIQGFGVPVIYDATHSVQMPGAAPGGKSTGGKRESIEVLARAAMAAGADGVFLECHPNPEKALSDGPNAFYLEHVGEFVRQLIRIREVVAEMPRLLTK